MGTGGTWNHNRPYCQREGIAPDPEHAATIYVREAKIVRTLDSWVAGLFSEESLEDTCQRLAEAATPDADREAQRRAIKDRLRQLEKEFDGYRSAIRAAPDASPSVGKWIAEAHQEHKRLEAMLGATRTSTITAEDVKTMVASLQDFRATLAAADPAEKATVYAEMGIDIT